MVEWWESLDTVLRVLYCITIPATLVMVIQTVLSILGGFEGGAGVDFTDTSAFGGDMDFDFDGGADIGELADADIGGSHDISLDGGNPADFSIASMFSVQGIVTFLMVMGWVAIASISSGANPMIAVLVGCGLGVLTMYLVARLMFASRRLAENGTVDIKNAIGENGSVYIPVPAKGGGEGKINLYLQGRFVEVGCITHEADMIPTGASVRVIDARNGVLIVERDT